MNRFPRRVLCAIVLLALAAGCGGDSSAERPDDPITSPDPSEQSGAAGDDPGASPEPQPFVPGAPVGTAEGYRALIDDAQAVLPADQRDDAPWPDLRNPDPEAAQRDIFDFWVWMLENNTDVDLLPVLSADASPTRTYTRRVFSTYSADHVLRNPSNPPYTVSDQVTVTAESSGLPLSYLQDVPEGSVVVFYYDSAGPTTTYDSRTGDRVGDLPARDLLGPWLSIMVPTDAGWRLWRDELLADVDPSYEVPETGPNESPAGQQPLL